MNDGFAISYGHRDGRNAGALKAARSMPPGIRNDSQRKSTRFMQRFGGLFFSRMVSQPDSAGGG